MDAFESTQVCPPSGVTPNRNVRDRLVRSYQELINRDELGEALDVCEQLVGLGNVDAQTWYNLAYLRRCRRHFRGALDAYARAIELKLLHPEHAHLNSAAILLDHLRQPQAAAEELRKAIAANRRFFAAWMNLGQAYEDLGNRESAVKAYRQALALDPNSGRAVARLWGLRAVPFDAIEAALKRVPPWSDDAAELHMAAAHYHETQKDFARAFAEMTRAKRIAFELTPPSERYDPVVAAELIEKAADNLDLWPGARSSKSGGNLIFVVGMFRSGSTLVERLLSHHARVKTVGEFEAVPGLAGSLRDYPLCLAALDEQERCRLSANYLAEALDIVGPFDVLVDKRPDNFVHLPLIKAMFPAARIVATRRNPRDTMISIFGNLFGPGVAYANRLSDIADWQVRHEQLMGSFDRRWPGWIHPLDYERLIADPRRTVAELLTFCGLEWDERCLDPVGSNAPVQTLSQWQVRQPIHARSVGRASNFSPWLDRALSPP